MNTSKPSSVTERIVPASSAIPTVYGYDGNGFTVGSRVELHPGCDLWMRGAKYGTVKGIVPTTEDAVRIELDRIPGRLFACAAETLRVIQSAQWGAI